MKIRKRSQFPKYVQGFKELKGISVGECIEGRDMADHAAHAHCFLNVPYQGWICLSHAYNLREKLTILHEVAHLIANKNINTPFHGKKWKEAVVAIGGTFKAYYYRYSGKLIRYPDYTKRYR